MPVHTENDAVNEQRPALSGVMLLAALYLPALIIGALTSGNGATRVVFASEAPPFPAPTPAAGNASDDDGPFVFRRREPEAPPAPAPPQPELAPQATDPAAASLPDAAAGPAAQEPQVQEPEPAPPLVPSPLNDNQLVVFYGSPLHEGLGILGMFSPEDAAQRVRSQAAVYDEINGDRGAVGALDVIYALAMDEPTDNGLYLRYLPDEVVERYIRVAEEYDLQLFLDLQIGRGDIVEEVRKIERFLVNPRVHVAIDPEYAVGPYGAPIVTPGQMSGSEINAAQDYVAELVRAQGLPQKMVVVHQYIEDTIVNGEETRKVPEVDLILNMDAFGPTDAKRERYHFFAARPYAYNKGFNIFLKQDERVMSEQEVLELTPQPDIIFYQ